MKKLRNILLSFVLVVSAVILSACGGGNQLSTDAKLDMSGKYTASSDLDIENALGFDFDDEEEQKLNLSQKGYHVTYSIQNEAGAIYSNNYAKLNERGGIREFAGITTEKYISKDGYKFQLQYETYVRSGRIYVQILAKTKAILGGKETVLKKQITYQSSFNNDFIVDEHNLTAYNGLYFSDETAGEAYLMMTAFSKALLEGSYNVSKSVNGTTTKFKTTVDYSKVDKTTTKISKLKDNMIVSNKVVTGFEFASDLKFGVSESMFGMGIDLNGMQVSYVEFDGEIDYADGLDKYSTTTPNLIEVNKVYDDFMAKLESEYEDLSFGFDFDLDIGGDDGKDEEEEDDDLNDGENTEDDSFTYLDLQNELGNSENPKIDLSQNKYKISYTDVDYFDESGEILVKYGEKDSFGYRKIEDLKSTVRFEFENSTGNVEVIINVDICNDKYYFKMTALGRATINGESRIINETFTYQCDSNNFYYNDNNSTITLYDGIREAKKLGIEDMFNNIDMVIDNQGKDCDISKTAVTNGIKYIVDLTEALNSSFESYGGSCENQYEEFVINNNNEIELYSLITKQSVMGFSIDRTFKIEKYNSEILHNITPSNYSQTKPDVTTIADFIDVMENPSLVTGTLVEYDDFIEIFGTSDSPKMSMGSKVYEVSYEESAFGEGVEIAGLVKYNGVEVEEASITTKLILDTGEDNINLTYYTDVYDGNIYIKLVATGNCQGSTLNETHTYKCSIEDIEYSYYDFNMFSGYEYFEMYFSIEGIYEIIDRMERMDGLGYDITKEDLSDGSVKYNIDGETTYIVNNNKIVGFEEEVRSCSQSTNLTITFDNDYSTYSTTSPNLDNINEFLNLIVGE